MHDDPAPVVIVGAGHAGGRAALTLRAEGYAGRLILIGDEPHPPYERPPLSKGLLLGTSSLRACSLCTTTALAEQGIEHLAGHPVTRLEPAHHRLRLGDGRWLPYSRLLLATGGRARRLPGVPEHLPGVHYLRTGDEALALREALRPGTRLVVVGGGFIGLEVAASARALDCPVVLLEAASRLAARALPERLSTALLDLHRARDVDVRLGVGLASVIGTQRVEAVQLSDGQTLPCDRLVVGIGLQPNTELAAAAGLEVGSGIRVDARLRTSVANIFAAGDVCEFRPRAGGDYQRQETWRNAEAQGHHAALNMLGREQPFETLPGFWSDQYDWSLQTVGGPTNGPPSATRERPDSGFLLLYLDANSRLSGACGWGMGNGVAKDIKLCERLIDARLPLARDALADPGIPLKHLLRG